MAKLFLFGVDKLISLIREDNADGVSKLLSRNPKLVQDRDKNGSTALIVAALLNRLEIGLILILRGADINAADTRLGYTALHIAVEKIHIAFATMLLERGADPNAINSKLFSALHIAALNGCREVVHLLIAKGAGLDPPDSLKRSPLLIAIEVGNTEVACMLIEHGCDITTKDKEKKTPIQNALEKGYLGIATLIECRHNQEAAMKRETNAAAKLLPSPTLLKSVSQDSASISGPAPLGSASTSASAFAPALASASHTIRDDNSSIVSRSSRRTGLSVGCDADTVVTGTSEAKKKKKKKVVVLTPATEGLEPEDVGGTEEQLVVKTNKKKKIPIASDPDPSLGL
jgi:ankyrin repeat protein